MTDFERHVVNYYSLSTPHPVEWPAELDESEEEDVATGKNGIRRSKSRYSALERSASDRRTLIPGAQRAGDGRANLVQKDEPDPLGGTSSVVRMLKQRNTDLESDEKTRNKYLLSSTTFQPALFLSQTHSNDSTQSLIQGLEYLTRSIDQKSASLKVLVESNFERFVRAKATIDNVYTEMRNQGMEAQPEQDRLSARHSRQVSRSSGHYRNFSSGSAAGMTAPAPTSKNSKNALRKESEYGVQGIKTPLLEVSQKAEDVWGPALGGREREAGLGNLVSAVETDWQLYELGANMSKSVKQKDYETIVEQYNLARNYASQAKHMADQAVRTRQPLTDEQVQRILATGRMWIDIEEQVKQLKRDIWRRLSSVQSILPLPGVTQAEEHMGLISVLLELGVDDNPIWVWLLSRYDYLKTKITAISERSKVEIEILRRRLAAAERTSSAVTASYLRQVGKDRPCQIDTDQVTELWEAILTYLTKLLSVQSGLLGEVIDFWDSTQSFVDGHKQKALPAGFEGQSRKHHRLSEAGVRDLEKGAIDLVNLIRDSTFSLFADPPVEDISLLFSPLPPNTPNTPLTATISPIDSRTGKLDPKMIPPVSPKVGEAWEDFAFWPPHANSLSGVHYLSRALVLIGTAAGEMASIAPVTTNNATSEKIKALVAGTRERCVEAICDAWTTDAECCKILESWTRSPERRDQTRMPAHFVGFERNILLGLQRVLYLSDAVSKAGAAGVIMPPSNKLLHMVKTQFMTSIYKAFSGMVENAENPIRAEVDDWTAVSTAVANAGQDSAFGTDKVSAPDIIDASSRNVRMLLTLSNLKTLRFELVPQLISIFESSFSIKLTDESKQIRDMLGQIDAKLFQSYIRPTISKLTETIRKGINSPDWVPATSRPDQVKPYVYSAMLELVMVHTEVSTTVPTSSTGGSQSGLLTEILQTLLETVSTAMLDAFSNRKPNHYTLPGLMQATLDTEFIAQTMAHYATKKANETQSQIYMELDKRTNNDNRAKLQQELGDMRLVLKRLRDSSKGSFGCFRKQRPGRPDRKVTE